MKQEQSPADQTRPTTQQELPVGSENRVSSTTLPLENYSSSSSPEEAPIDKALTQPPKNKTAHESSSEASGGPVANNASILPAGKDRFNKTSSPEEKKTQEASLENNPTDKIQKDASGDNSSFTLLPEEGSDDRLTVNKTSRAAPSDDKKGISPSEEISGAKSPLPLEVSMDEITQVSLEDDENNSIDLDEPTMSFLLNFLKTSKYNCFLDEHVVAQRLIRLNKIASERTRLAAEDPSHLDSSDDEGFYLQEKDFVQREMAIKEIMAGAKREAIHRNVVLNSRTTSILRKALGFLGTSRDVIVESGKKFSRAAEAVVGTANGNDSDDSGAAKRLTRAQARDTRIRRREERVVRENLRIESLLAAIRSTRKYDNKSKRARAKRYKKRTRDTKLSGEGKKGKLGEDKQQKKKQKEKNKAPVKDTVHGEPKGLFAVVPLKQNNVEASTVEDDNGNVLMLSKTIRVRRIIINGKPVRTKRTHHGVTEVDGVAFGGETSRKKKQKTEHGSESESDVDARIRDEFGESSHGKAPISLSLLDWRRRQLFTAAAKKSKGGARAEGAEGEYEPGAQKKLLMNSGLSTADIDACLPTWESINPNPDLPKQPSTLEPPRKRHSDHTYAEWCSKLINCLSGSGRMMAHYEFFYSDIDRAWFKFNPFEVELARLGIPKDAKFSRSEWSLIRQQTKHRPRRFSRRLINSELAKLNQYRENVRNIQNSKRPELYTDFGYEVPAPIRVGSTVTAFNKKAQILHRGIVLQYDAKKHGYLIQFERKALGYEFCSDIDVASHGVPDILKRASEVALDGSYIGSAADPNSRLGSLPYGTSYGPLVDFHKEKNDRAIAETAQKTGSRVSLDKTCVAGEGEDSSGHKRHAAEDEAADRGVVIEKVAERETLVKMLGMVDAMTARKAMLMKALEKCHSMHAALNADGTSTTTASKSFQEHYAWLHSNLRMTNAYLDAAVVHMQVMYGKAYAGTPDVVQENDINRQATDRENILQEMSQIGQTKDTLSSRWSDESHERSTETASALVTKILKEGGYEPPYLKTKNVREEFIESRFVSAGSLLLTAKFCQDSQQKRKSSGRVLHAGALGEALQAQVRRLAPSTLPGASLEEWDSLRRSGYRALCDATNQLLGELAYLNAETKGPTVVSGEVAKRPS